jgi:hypothetical protein
MGATARNGAALTLDRETMPTCAPDRRGYTSTTTLRCSARPPEAVLRCPEPLSAIAIRLVQPTACSSICRRSSSEGMPRRLLVEEISNNAMLAYVA